MTRLSRLLRPRSVAVLGSVWAENVITQCQKMGFDGPVWPVHPTRETVGGVRAFQSLADLPGVPDATFIGVNRFATLDVVRDLAAMGAGGAICFASGWEEAGETGLQAELVAAAGAMPVLGPNCYGVINYLDGALLWPDQHGGERVERGVALLSQSSNIVINMTMQARGLPVAYVACLGNAAQVGLAELAGALLADERVTALGMYVEGIDDAPALARLAAEAARAGKGIVCLKSGKTELSRVAAASHTASLAGEAAVSSAFFRKAGIAEVSTLPELLETLKIFHAHGRGLGPRLCSLSCSGGEAGLVADLGAAAGVEFQPPSEAQRARLGEILGPIVAIANPLDYHTFIWGDGPRTTDVFATMLAGYDAGVFIIDPPRPDRCDPSSFRPALEAIVAAARQTGKPAFAVSSLPENFDEALAGQMMAEGVVPLMGLEAALGAICAAQSLWDVVPESPLPARPLREALLLDEAAAKAVLRGAGVPVPVGVTARSLDEAARLAAGLRAPLVLKGLGFAHKTEAGAVRLGLTSLEGAAEMPGATGYLVEEMATGAVAEVLVGLRRDPVYGVSLTLGMGGVTAELLADTVTLVLPVTGAQVRDALGRLRLFPLLDGYRGRPRGDVAALVGLVLRLCDLMADDGLEEIELNPVLVFEQGVMAVDALMRKG
ncbi:acetate--CoA ligase family protein [Pseudotabrizicola algicola]|uniref:Acetate--CoA ligase family protein n=1 Tax=Pseudotabrizicola algicola TaxID=2709381 RepID=A0A6B3RP82_9RHOB|nr:acetate--CoA ligase family protein [Pseudotabrizicola algicola]NEX47003.1 acetate--CoA ligase family protein [Pseudotabrizicola algicola]